MSLKEIGSILIACQLALLPSLAQAQASSFDQAFAPQGVEARLSFTVPLGQSKTTSKSAPRVGFAVRNYENSAPSPQDWMLADPKPYRETQLSFTLEKSPLFMMNDQLLVLPKNDQVNLGVPAKVGLGVVAVAVSAFALLVVLFVTADRSDC